MKTPRVHDFDPNTNIPSLGSPMDNLPAIQKPQKEIQPEGAPVPPVRVVPPGRPVPPVPLERDVLPVPLTKRVMKPRHPFDIYLDQYESLKQLADEDRRQGGLGSMSAMVREAIDTFIAKRNRKGK